MKKDKFKTKVVFLIEKPEGNLKCDVFAFMLNEKHNHDPNLFTSYAHIGQHSPCHLDYAKECELAGPEQYKDLAAELESIGYNLEILTNL